MQEKFLVSSIYTYIFYYKYLSNIIIFRFLFFLNVQIICQARVKKLVSKMFKDVNKFHKYINGNYLN